MGLFSFLRLIGFSEDLVKLLETETYHEPFNTIAQASPKEFDEMDKSENGLPAPLSRIILRLLGLANTE